MDLFLATLLTMTNFLQPSGLPNCGTYPRPSCLMPDIPSLEWQSTNRRYTWPLESNSPPLSRITYHRRPEVYGTYPPLLANVMMEYCLIDEVQNTADCFSEWEYQTDAVCSLDRWTWISKPNALGGRLVREDVRQFHEHAGRVQVYLWEFSRGMGYLPNIGPTTPTPDVTFKANRTQVVRRGPTTSFSPFAMLFISDGNAPEFNIKQAYNSGITNRLPLTEYEEGACTASFIFETSWCQFAPWRPECPGNNTNKTQR